MSIRLGLALCALAGCTMQPTQPAAFSQLARNAALDRFAHGNALCLGVEHLPPEGDRQDTERLPLRVLEGEMGIEPNAQRVPLVNGPERSTAHGIGNDKAGDKGRIASLSDRFVEEFVGRDGRRLRREFAWIGFPTNFADPQGPSIALRSDELAAEDQDQRLGESGHQALRRPLQRMARSMPVVTRVETQVADLTGWQDAEPMDGQQTESVELGRLTMSLRPTRTQDPLEVGYRRSGFMVATTQQQWKCGYAVALGNDIYLDLRARQIYLDSSWQMRAELRWQRTLNSSIHLVVGDGVGPFLWQAPYYDDPSMQPSGIGIQLHAVYFF